MLGLEVCIFVVVMIGFLGLIYKCNLLMKIVVMDVISIGVIVYYCFVVVCIGIIIFIVGVEVFFDFI